jgi:hypothetical protein
VINELLQIQPEVLPIFVTTAPRWLLEKYVQGDFLHRPRRLDVGVLQRDSLHMDLPATLAELQDLQARARQLIEAEVNFISTNRVRLVFADIPPLAAAIAQAAGVPCWMASNFGWDFIYQNFGGEFHGVAEWIAQLYRQCDRLFRLPLSEPMSAFPLQDCVGLTGGDPRAHPDQLRSEWGLDPQRPTVLLTFGGLGVQGFPYHRLQAFPDWQFITFDTDTPDLPNLLRLNGQTWRPVDVMPLCSQIVSKPGYSTLAEALKTGTPISCITREGFAEADLLVQGLQQYGKHRVIPQQVFFQDPWTFLEADWVEPISPNGLDRGGNQTIAEALQTFLTK